MLEILVGGPETETEYISGETMLSVATNDIPLVTFLFNSWEGIFLFLVNCSLLCDQEMGSGFLT